MKLDKKEPEIIGSVISLELPIFERPKFADKIRWPNDLTQLTAQNVSELLGRFTQMVCYADAHWAKVQQEIMALEHVIHQRKIHIYEDSPSLIRLDKNKRELNLDSDPGIAILKSRLSRLKRAEIKDAMYVRNYERYVAALSRELSRKTASGDGLRYAKTGRE